ncbi:MAG: LysR family transcriptional regulator [Pseudomonadales bacterium]|jgi:LysR family transcriptional activator of nhaA|nr:LysR family transcriptional regulator [Pseudomonadales bacterium]
MARLNYNHLRYFWAVAHNGNLTRTAEQLHVSQSALSLQIRKLEEQLGHDLFERRGKQLVLTEAGRLALDHADVIFAAGDELLSTLQHAGHSRDLLRVGALATLSRNFQTRFLEPHFGRDDIGMVVRSGRLPDLLAQLEAHHLDVVLTNEVPPRDAATPWIVQLLDEQPVELVGPPKKGLEERSLADLLTTENLIVPTVETSIRAAFDALVHRLGVVPNLAAEVDDMALIRLLARSGEGLAVIPPIVARDELASGRLVEVAELPGITESFHAITLARKFPHPLLGELLAAFD